MPWSNRRLLEKTPDISEIYTLLYQLSLTANYTGFFHTAYAVHLAVQQPERLILVTKWLYPEVAKHYATTWKCVERNIRTTVDVVWDSNVERLEALARHPLSKRPSVSEFISILALHFSLDSAS